MIALDVKIQRHHCQLTVTVSWNFYLALDVKIQRHHSFGQ